VIRKKKKGWNEKRERERKKKGTYATIVEHLPSLFCTAGCLVPVAIPSCRLRQLQCIVPKSDELFLFETIPMHECVNKEEGEEKKKKKERKKEETGELRFEGEKKRKKTKEKYFTLLQSGFKATVLLASSSALV
jgi:hypothetical protein